MPSPSGAQVLVVDDSRAVRLTFGMLLEEAGFRVTGVDSLAGARSALAGAAFDLVLLDQHLGDGLGTELLPTLERLAPRPVVVLLSGDPQAQATGVDAFIPKGGNPRATLARLGALVASRAGQPRSQP